jgi:putative nucleotidyltransferase with HDIG domain
VLKRISTGKLRVGMYVLEFCGPWIDHPFWRERFVIANEVDLKTIVDSPILEVVIDASKGLDVEDAVAPARAGASGSAGQPAPGPVPAAAVAPAAAAARQATPAARHVDKEEELERAARILADSREVVATMFGEARLGGVRDVGEAMAAVDNIAGSVARHPMAMIGLARLKSADDYTFMHSVAVSALMVALARTLGLAEDEVRVAGMAGLLHDVGKAQIPLDVLNKPGSLDDTEWSLMRSHPERGHRILQDSRGASGAVLDAVLHHHEKIDGTGYPHALPAGQIATLARMTAVCDVYDAVTSNRPYKAGWQPTVAIRKMKEWAGGHLDESLFKAFVKTMGIYPVGSLVRLQSNRLAVVIDHDPAQLLQPTVRAFFSLRSNMHIPPVDIALGSKSAADRIVGIEDPAAHGLSRVDEIWSMAGTAA